MRRWLALFLGLWAGLGTGFGAGVIIVHEPDFWGRTIIWPPHPPPHPIPRPWPPPAPVWAPLEVSFVQAHAKIKDQVATTKVEEEFYNPNPRQLEGTFLFPLPQGAHLDKFTLEINGRQVEAELLGADKARGIYEDIVRRLRDPALLEYAGQGLLKARIFPIEPHAKKRITLTYTQVLPADNGLVTYQLPLSTEKFSAQPLKNVSVQVELESSHVLKSIYSPSHKVEIKRDGDKRAVVGFEASQVKPDADFSLLFTPEANELGATLMTYKPPGEEGFFMLLATPGLGDKKTKIMPKDAVFVLDTSGSMAGEKLEQAKRALLFCIENLNENDRFEIMRFSTEVEPLNDTLTEVSGKTRAKAREFVKGLRPIGGTAIDDALAKALALRPAQGDRPFVIIFLTDGRPTIGTTDEDEILKHVAKNNQNNTRIFVFGIGTDVNTHLLDRVAEETKAFSQYVLPEEDLEVKVSSFYTKIREPLLANPKLTFTRGIRISKYYPSPLPDLFKGAQLLVVGRYTGDGDSAATIEGMVEGEARKFSFDARFAKDGGEFEFIPRLWATRRVGYLLDEIRLHGDSKELKDEVTDLARKYGIVTPYTAYLIMEDEKQRGVAQPLRTLPEFERDERFRTEAGRAYDSFKTERAGSGAVGGARSFYSLKSAQASSEAIVSGNAEALRAAPLAAPSSSARAASGGYVTRNSTRAPTDAPSAESALAQQGRFVAGKTFYFNHGQWIDSEAQKLAHAPRVKLQFGSPDYFAWLKKHPEATAWLSLGAAVQVVVGGEVIEVVE